LPFVRSNQCNGTALETPIGIQITHNTLLGIISDMALTLDHIYLSMDNGDWVKISKVSSSIVWGIKYGGTGNSLALSTDQSFLVAGSYDNSKVILGKLASSDGSVIASYSVNESTNYDYIFVSDTRALCFTSTWF